jgi:hypothetical protein
MQDVLGRPADLIANGAAVTVAPQDVRVVDHGERRISREPFAGGARFANTRSAVA